LQNTLTAAPPRQAGKGDVIAGNAAVAEALAAILASVHGPEDLRPAPPLPPPLGTRTLLHAICDVQGAGLAVGLVVGAAAAACALLRRDNK
jgi:hypothetical protein